MPIKPFVLQPDNFTPATRTPWGGKKILNKYKRLASVSKEKSSYDVVGESWELSVEPDFPSLTLEGIPLARILASDPVRMLGKEAERGRTSTALLLKLLDAGENLSLQIHPRDDYDALKQGETGKSECWYVIDHEAGAGIYFGFQSGVDESRMKKALEMQDDISSLLYFFPVSRGDFFVIEPGTPHALGKGVTLIEPQYVAPGCRGITYRYWDWNRRYDAKGKEQPAGGQPRQLHIEHALAVTAWNHSAGESLMKNHYVASGIAALDSPAVIEALGGPGQEARLCSSCLRTSRLAGTGRVVLPSWNALCALTVVEGEVRVGEKEAEIVVRAGQTAAIPACLTRVQAQLERAHALLCAVHDS
jgi:mannose-6-phosphate isomerase class I